MNQQSPDPLTQILLNALNGNDSLRKEAENQIFRLASENLTIFLINVSSKISNEQEEKQVRQISATIIKNIISKSEYTQKWLNLDEKDKIQIKNHVLSSLASQDIDIRKAAGNVIACFCKFESSNNSPKSSYGNTYPSPFSSKSKSNKSKSKSNSNYSNSKNSYHHSHSHSHSHSRSHSDSKSPMSRSKSKSKSNYNSSHSHRSYHHKPKSIPQVFITKLSYYVTKRDLEKEFGKFGEIRNLTLKKGYGFVEYYDKKDAKYAIRELNGRKLFGQSNRIVVEEAKVSRQLREKERRRRRSKSRDKEKDRDKDRDRDKDKDKEDKKENDYYYRRKIGPKKTDICFSCGKEGHWANECQENRRDR